MDTVRPTFFKQCGRGYVFFSRPGLRGLEVNPETGWPVDVKKFEESLVRYAVDLDVSVGPVNQWRH